MADTKNEIFREIIQRSLMLKIGQHSVVIIKKRVADGIFLEGSSDSASQYSTKPFAMPTGAIKPRSLMMDIIKGRKPVSDVELFKSKSGKLWVVIKRGYKWLREQAGKPSGKVDMRWTSELMRSLTILSVNPEQGEIVIGHRGKRNEQIAYWHNVAGAGKSRKIRKWLMLSDAELEKVGNKNI